MVGEELDEALLEFRTQALFRLAEILSIRANLKDVRQLVGHLSDQQVLARLIVQNSYQPPAGRISRWWVAVVGRLRSRS